MEPNPQVTRTLRYAAVPVVNPQLKQGRKTASTSGSYGDVYDQNQTKLPVLSKSWVTKLGRFHPPGAGYASGGRKNAGHASPRTRASPALKGATRRNDVEAGCASVGILWRWTVIARGAETHSVGVWCLL